MKVLILIAFLLPTLLTAQQTYVPDDQFEKELIRLGLDSGPLDDYVLTSSIDTVKILYLRNKRISNLTGIEGFVTLDTLFCNENK